MMLVESVFRLVTTATDNEVDGKIGWLERVRNFLGHGQGDGNFQLLFFKLG